MLAPVLSGHVLCPVSDKSVFASQLSANKIKQMSNIITFFIHFIHIVHGNRKIDFLPVNFIYFKTTILNNYH